MAISDEMIFEDEDDNSAHASQAGYWQVLVVDDDSDVHKATSLTTRDLVIEDKKLALHHAYSAEQAYELLEESNDFAVILLDVVMETDDAGLRLVKKIRRQLNNTLVRIILRTGQPGYAPETDTIRDYDINDYKTKTELTRTRLFTSLTTAVRTYRQMLSQREMVRGLETVVRASTELTKLHGMQRFSEGLVVQLSALLGMPPEGLVCAEVTCDTGFPARIIAAAGQYHHLINEPLSRLPENISQIMQQCLSSRTNIIDEGLTLYFPTDSDHGIAAHVDVKRTLDDNEKHLLRVFSASMSVGFDNVLLYKKLSNQAYVDSLLGIANLNQLIEWLQDSDIVKSGHSLALVDIDDFSMINDTFGHESGDMLLLSVYQRIRMEATNCRVARTAGDVFAVVGPDSVLSAENFTNVFLQPFACGSEFIRLTATAGILPFKDQTSMGSGALQDAHLALKQGKLHHRGAATYFDEQFGAHSREHMRLLRSLREAFSQTELFLVYQPKVCARTEKTVGFEALIRWKNKNGDLIPPDRFIPLAEKSGMIIPMGFYVFRKACEFLTQLHQMGHGELTIAVNVSHIQLREPDFVEQLTNILEQTQVERHALELEITESIASDDIDSTMRKLNEIKQLGVRISIDDFGTGFSSLSVLRHLPASSLKIDKAFVDEIMVDEHIPRMVIDLGHNLGMTVIAEGVETQEQLTRLRELGCDTVQGWLYSPAITEDQVKEWLQETHAGNT